MIDNTWATYANTVVARKAKAQSQRTSFIAVLNSRGNGQLVEVVGGLLAQIRTFGVRRATSSVPNSTFPTGTVTAIIAFY